ncbi:MAG: ABC transporter ATP-binding protein [Desulfobacteraceae bacterium]|nr:MAG: ABC transporter ATP-binding protein [Desulfobacteraceae bacterium]
MLETERINTFYGLSHVLFDVSLRVKAGQAVCILGRNGAGKTTLLKSIMGLAPPKTGCIRLNGEEVTGWAPYRLSRRGIGYVPDDRRIFADLTVEENLQIAARGPGKGDWSKERVYELFPKLAEIALRKGGLLSGGEQKMLAIARALMTNPTLLLLDEPTEGLAPVMVRILEERIDRLKKEGLTVLLAEQNMDFALGLSGYGYVLENGRITHRGTIEELTANEAVRRTCGI